MDWNAGRAEVPLATSRTGPEGASVRCRTRLNKVAMRLHLEHTACRHTHSHISILSASQAHKFHDFLHFQQIHEPDVPGQQWML